MKTIRIPNCQELSFSVKHSQKRIERAKDVFDYNVIKRIISFALYLLGLGRKDIGKTLVLPVETVKSINKALMRDGLIAIEDRRRRILPPVSHAPEGPPPITLKEEEKLIIIDFGFPNMQIKLCKHDALQMRTVLLTMFNSGLLTSKEVAKAIGITVQHTKNLAEKLLENGALSLAEKRKGQKQDYRVTTEIKAQIIQQFAVQAVTGEPTSSIEISEKLKERCSMEIPARTVRHHLGKLGLPKIKGSLPQLVAAVKKNYKNGVSK